MNNKIHNLDEGVVEYFEFIVKGYKFKFRQLTTEEMETLRDFKDDEEKVKEYLYSFITRTDESSPEFSEVAKKMFPTQWNKFRSMLEAEFK